MTKHQNKPLWFLTVCAALCSHQNLLCVQGEDWFAGRVASLVTVWVLQLENCGLWEDKQLDRLDSDTTSSRTSTSLLIAPIEDSILMLVVEEANTSTTISASVRMNYSIWCCAVFWTEFLMYMFLLPLFKLNLAIRSQSCQASQTHSVNPVRHNQTLYWGTIKNKLKCKKAKATFWSILDRLTLTFNACFWWTWVCLFVCLFCFHTQS